MRKRRIAIFSSGTRYEAPKSGICEPRPPDNEMTCDTRNLIPAPYTRWHARAQTTTKRDTGFSGKVLTLYRLSNKINLK